MFDVGQPAIRYRAATCPAEAPSSVYGGLTWRGGARFHRVREGSAIGTGAEQR
jgi:hypothetical protein